MKPDRPAGGRPRRHDDGRGRGRRPRGDRRPDVAGAFVLGAIVSPTDPIAATAIARRLGVPRKLVTIVEGESLVNDGTGLVLYRVAVAAVVDRVVLGLLHSRALPRQRRRRSRGRARGRVDRAPGAPTPRQPAGRDHDLPAHRVLRVHPGRAARRLRGACRGAAGVYLGWHTPELTSPQVRLQALGVWEIVQYLLNALLFVSSGSSFPSSSRRWRHPGLRRSSATPRS